MGGKDKNKFSVAVAVFSLRRKNGYTCSKYLLMDSDTFYIKKGEHFKLWLQLKDKIAFEAELMEKGIPYHIDENQSTLGSDIRYFMPDEYKEQIDNVIKHTGIIASTDTIAMYDIENSRDV
jgi:hypothetical protein